MRYEHKIPTGWLADERRRIAVVDNKHQLLSVLNRSGANALMFRIEGSQPIYNYLNSLSFDVLSCGGWCPFQIEANHSSGISLYFHARGEIATLTVYSTWLVFNELLDDSEIIWEGWYKNWDFPDAGYIGLDEAFYVLYSLWSNAKDFVFD